MIQVKVGIEEKTMDPVEKILLTNENGEVTKSKDADKTIKTLINSGKIV